VGNNIAIVGVASGGPAEAADVRAGDLVLAVAGVVVSDLGDLFRRVWSLGEAGVDVPLTIDREGSAFDVIIESTDRRRLLKGPVLH
jgi:S1-C subfamily serine protease